MAGNRCSMAESFQWRAAPEGRQGEGSPPGVHRWPCGAHSVSWDGLVGSCRGHQGAVSVSFGVEAHRYPDRTLPLPQRQPAVGVNTSWWYPNGRLIGGWREEMQGVAMV